MSTIVNILNKFSDQLNTLSKLFSLSIGLLPKGETIPSADMLTIVGEDMIK